MRQLSKILMSRGMHRHFGSPTIGTLSAFITVVILLRAAVNLYFTMMITTAGNPVEIGQIAAGWYFYLCAYVIACRSLSAMHLRYALPDSSFLDTAPLGRQFKSLFMRQSVMLRPMNIAALALILAGSLIFILAGADAAVILSGLLQISVSVLLAAVVFRLAVYLSADRNELQIIESLFLLIIMMLNPDVIRLNGLVTILFQGRFFRFDSLPVATAFTAGTFISVCVVLLASRLLSAAGGKISRLSFTNPINSWYWRFFTVKYWMILYIFMIPILLSAGFPYGLKRYFCLFFVLFSGFSYIVFVNSCINSIRLKLLSHYRLSGNPGLFGNSLIMHLTLTLPPPILFLAGI